MRTPKKRSTDDVVEFPRSREIAEPVTTRRVPPDAGLATETPPVTVLNAERGVINTGTVHGGQHVTTIEVSGHVDGEPDDGI